MVAVKLLGFLHRKVLQTLLLCVLHLSNVTSDYMPVDEDDFEVTVQLQPCVMVALLVRNKAHVLPYSLYYLEQLDYPKHRISLWSVWTLYIKHALWLQVHDAWEILVL